MRNARRPDVFNRDAIIEHFVAQGLAKSMAEPLTSDLKLIVPILIRDLGVERINEILQRQAAGLHLRGFFPGLTRYIVRWAEEELATYKARKESDGGEP